MSSKVLQTTHHLMMVRPAHFGYNEETASSNAFQSKDETESSDSIRQKAVAEFDAFVEKLRAAGVEVLVIQDSDSPVKPDAVFPNNWITMHHDGTLITYPMLSLKRRLERRDDVIQTISSRFLVTRKIQLEEFETVDLILEGTGSMIFDHPNKLVYACLSPRTSPELLHRLARHIRYEPVGFHAEDGNGQEIYHTNVMMAMGETFVVICLDTVRRQGEAAMLRKKFASTNKEVIEINLEQMMSFAGNMLQVRNAVGETFLVMSAQAFSSLMPSQIEQIQRHTNLLYSPIPTIEKYGGGSARCMMAEIFLPKK
jgi:hypothetical protein